MATTYDAAPETALQRRVTCALPVRYETDVGALTNAAAARTTTGTVEVVVVVVVVIPTPLERPNTGTGTRLSFSEPFPS